MGEVEIMKPLRRDTLILVAITLIMGISTYSSNKNWVMIEAISVGGDPAHAYPPPTTLTLQLASLFPLHNNNNSNNNNTLPHTCMTSSHEKRKGASLHVRHKYGPCSPFDSNKNVHVTLEDILEHDESRVKVMRERISPKKVGVDKDIKLPAKSGDSVGYANFVVTVGMGTPKKDLILAFDTGSSLTWTQCEPCAGGCYEQKKAIFDPSKSSTYSNISCTSNLCSDVISATTMSPQCLSQTCIYTIVYGDASVSQGYLAKDTLYLSPQDAVPNFYFGCGQNNEGFSGVSGLLGLSSNNFSALSQTASSYGYYFSYCLPFNPTSTGHLTFGKAARVREANTMQYTPLVRPPSRLAETAQADLYFVEVQGISVEGKRLGIAPTVFSRVGTIIDSGSTITTLPMEAYTALSRAFTQATSKYNYPKPQAFSLLDTCYHFSSQSNLMNITVPSISLHFGGGARMDLPPTGIFFAVTHNLLCLAFRGSTQSDDMAVLGNTQQLTFDIVYDVAASTLGFASDGCL